MSEPVGVRLAVPDDLRFVSASWFESYWKSTMALTRMRFDMYRRGQDALIRRLVERSETLVVHAADIPDEILGYAVVEQETLHYVYVKSVYRRRGIATGLVRSRAKAYSHQTRLGEKLVKSLGLEFNPYAVHGAP